MRTARPTHALVFVLAPLIPTPVPAQESPVPLFAAAEPLDVTITADFHQLRRDRDDENEEREGTALLGGDGSTAIPLKIRTRGRFRLQSRTCEFPPLRLNFPKSALAGTVLDGQDKLKLVAHCRNRDDYEENVLEEYLVYRLLNLLTERSFQVRLVRFTYMDVTEREDTVQRWGFLLESEEALAGRLGGSLMDEEVPVNPGLLLGRNTGLVSLFLFMVGNTDWSMLEHHNVVLVRTGDGMLPVPYDFDWTGFVDAPYARPAPSLGIRSVRQRIYREFCRPDIDHPALFRLFRERRAAMEAEILGLPGLPDDRKKDAIEYLGEFFEIIDDPKKAQRQVIEGCRAV
jgi:hypothetical protein